MSETCPTSLGRESWTRRETLRSIAAVTALTAFGGSQACAQGAREFSPEMFGARGDGRSDDYTALMRLAAAVNRAGGGTVTFGRRKQYRIDQFRIWGGPGRNEVSQILFVGCRRLTIDLNGSTIHVKGNFHRRGDAREGRASFSSAVIPLAFDGCSNVIVENGTLHGHANEMTRDPRVAERDGHGIAINGCRSVEVRNLHIHHFSSDGIRIGTSGRGRDRIPSEGIRLNRVRLTNNARQGLTNAGAADVVATDCEFSESGRTGGTYAHAPMAGVDVEPMFHYSVRSDFRAIRCRFDNNAGSPVVAGNPDLISFVELIDCGGRSPIMKRMILSSERAVVRGGSWHNIQIACGYAAHGRYQRTISVDVGGAVWSGDDPNWSPVYDASTQRPNTRIHDNRFELRSPRPLSQTYVFLCPNPNHHFENNEIFVARTGHDGQGPDHIANFQGARLVAGNRWSTDLRPPLRFLNNYTGAQRVERESYSGSFSGTGRR